MKTLKNSVICLTLQTCMNLFLLLNAKEDILKNMDNQTVDGSL